MNTFQDWHESNNVILKDLYHKLIMISQSYGITIINGSNSYKNFLTMMYNESNKDIIDDNIYYHY